MARSKKSETAKHGAADHEDTHAATDRADSLRKRPAARSGGPKKTVKTRAHEHNHETDHDGALTHDHDHEPAHDDATDGGYGAFGRMLYRATYAVTYGLVFPVMLLAHAVPTDNAVVQGLLDGAEAARDAAGSIWANSSTPALDAPGHAIEHGHEHAPALQPA